MPEYVDKEFVIEKLDELIYLASAGVPIKPIRIEGTEKLILMEKTDVAPVVHGRWNKDGRCTNCGSHAPFWCMASTYYKSPFCFECGAKMDLE